MNDLRSPSEDRPYHVSTRPEPRSARLAQDDVDPEYGMSFFDRVRYSRWFPLASVFAAVLIFSGIVSYAYKQGSQTGVNATTPVVAADTKDYKTKPANPGGMDVPFQDAVVFDQLQNKGQAPADGKVESLLPPPEQPVAGNTAATTAPASPAAPVTAPAAATQPAAANGNTPASATPAAPATAPAPAATTTPATTTSSAVAAPSTATPGAPVAPVAQTTAVAAAPAPVAASAPEAEEENEAPAPVAAKPAPVKKAAVKKAAAVAPKTTAAPKVAAGTYRIQLGAFRDESAARAAWAKVAKQYSALSGVTPAFPRADLGAKGIFYRAQGINLSKSSADSLCSTINAGKAGSCIVAH